MRKSYPSAEFEPAMIIQRLQVQILREDNFFTLLVLSSRCLGGFFLGFSAVAFRPEARKRINIKTLACKRHNILIKLLSTFLFPKNLFSKKFFFNFLKKNSKSQLHVWVAPKTILLKGKIEQNVCKKVISGGDPPPKISGSVSVQERLFLSLCLCSNSLANTLCVRNNLYFAANGLLYSKNCLQPE